MADPVEVLDFWVGELGEDGWFDGGDVLDGEIRERFGELWQAALDGGLEHWVDGVVGSLAYLILCDQMPRNMFRGSPQAFATDAQARIAARKALAEGWDMGAPEPERMFFYMPFRHSEVAEDQTLSVSLMTDRLPMDPSMALYARASEQVIARFGRFPHRNLALGRDNTPEEDAYLAEGGFQALVNSLRPSHAEPA